jgi:hypothetical protein
MSASSLPPMPASADLLQFLSMVRTLVADKRGRELLDLLAVAVGENEKAAEALRKERAALEVARTEHHAVVTKERQEAAAAMAKERAAWASERAARLGEVERTEAQAKEVLARAKSVEANALAVQRDLRQRLSRMSELAA